MGRQHALPRARVSFVLPTDTAGAPVIWQLRKFFAQDLQQGLEGDFLL